MSECVRDAMPERNSNKFTWNTLWTLQANAFEQTSDKSEAPLKKISGIAWKHEVKKSRKCSCTWVPMSIRDMYLVTIYISLSIPGHAEYFFHHRLPVSSCNYVFFQEHISKIHPCRQARRIAQLIPKLFTSIRSDLKKVQRRNKSV